MHFTVVHLQEVATRWPITVHKISQPFPNGHLVDRFHTVRLANALQTLGGAQVGNSGTVLKKNNTQIHQSLIKSAEGSSVKLYPKSDCGLVFKEARGPDVSILDSSCQAK